MNNVLCMCGNSGSDGANEEKISIIWMFDSKR
jgi:hypothetical protein